MSLAWGRLRSSMNSRASHLAQHSKQSTMRSRVFKTSHSAPLHRIRTARFLHTFRTSSTRRTPHCTSATSYTTQTLPSRSRRSLYTAWVEDSTTARVAALGALLGGTGLAYYVASKTINRGRADEQQQECRLEEPQRFEHPHDSKHWAWQLYFKTKRFLYLFAVFLPCATAAAIAHVTKSDEWRAYVLDMLVDALNSAGCGVQKFGQWLSMRPDMFPADVIAALGTMRQDIPAHDIQHTRLIIRESFGVELEDMFESFEEQPVASGTVAQVHRGRLKLRYAEQANIRGRDGQLVRDVAVKVRHPNVLDEVWVDIEMLYKFCQWSQVMTIPFTKDDFLYTLQKQVDFNWEAYHLARFQDNFKDEVDSGAISFPQVSHDLLSEAVLMESWAEGTTVSSIFSDVGEGFKVVSNEFQKVGQACEDVAHEVGEVISEELAAKKKALASTIFDMTIKMFLRDNLCHGDLHGGNVMFDVQGNCCTVLDAGMTTSLSDDVQGDFGQFLHALCTADSQRLVDKILSFHVDVSDEDKAYSGQTASNFSSEDPAERERARQLFAADVQRAMDLYVGPGGCTGPDGGPISLGDVIGEVMFALQRHGVSLRGDVASSLMTMSITEGLIRSLDPDYDLVASALPYFVRYSGTGLLSGSSSG